MASKNIELYFQEFMQKNIEQTSYFENMRDLFLSLKNKQSIESNEFEERDKFFSFIKKDKTDTQKLYESIYLNEDSVISLLDDFIEHLKNETDSLKQYFSGLDFENISSLQEFERKCQAYNQKEFTLLSELRVKTNNLFELENKVFSLREEEFKLEHQMFEKASEQFLRYFADFYLLVSQKGDKTQILNSLLVMLEYLSQYEKQYSTLSKSYADVFIEASKQHLRTKSQVKKLFNLNLASSELKTFKTQYFLLLRRLFSNTLLNSTLVTFKPFMDKLGWEGGRITNPYNIANDGDKLDKLLKDSLNSIFDGIVFYTKENGSESKEINELSIKITKVGDKFEEIKDEFNEVYESLVRTKFSTLSYLSGKSFEDLSLKSDGMGSEMSFKEIKSKSFFDEKNKDTLKSVILFMRTLIDSDAKEDPFKTFKSHNVSLGVIKGKSEGEDEDSLWKDADSIPESDVVSVFQEGKQHISARMESLELILGESSNFSEGGILIESAKEGINGLRNEIVTALKTLGKNLEKYCQREGLDIEPIEKELKTLIKDNWLKLSFTNQSIKSAIASTNAFLRIIK